MTDTATATTLQELWRLLGERKAPNGTPPESFGPYREMIESLHLAYTDTAESNEALSSAPEAMRRLDLIKEPSDEVARHWGRWSGLADYQGLAEQFQQLVASHPLNKPSTSDLRWLVAQLESLPPEKDGVELRNLLKPTLDQIIALPDDVLVVACLEEMRRFFQWKRDIFTAYRDLVTKTRKRKAQAARADDADVPTEADELGETVPPPIFLSPALANHNGVTYLSHKMAYKVTKRSKRGAVSTVAWKPIILSSDRRRIIPQRPPDGSDPDSIWWLDEGQRLALSGGFADAPEHRWSYDSIVAFLHGGDTKPTAHGVFDALMESLKKYVYHADEYSYTVDVLWAMGSYFYRLWNAYPYLALHGERGAGKSTLLTWLWAVGFNAEFVVNTSEASLYRSIQAKAPTLLIDEQEGLNSSKAAKETKADLMGLLKSGYKAGAKVARQRIDRPELTEYFDVYSPKALAAIELFEDVLENRAILTFMTPKPSSVKTEDDGAIIRRFQSEFGTLRDQLYLLLMYEADTVRAVTERVKFSAHNRFRELFLPLYAMAALVDASRGEGRHTLDVLDQASEAKAKVRKERDQLTPEETLRQAFRVLCDQANDDATDFDHGTIKPDGWVLVDAIQIKHTFESLFSSRDQSFFNDQWLGKQVMKLEGVRKGMPDRHWRNIEERDGYSFETKTIRKYVACYLLNPAVYAPERINA